MLSSHHGLRGAICALALLTVGCAAHAPAPQITAVPPAAVASVPAAVPVPVVQPETDPVGELLAVSMGHFGNGQRELDAGHIGTAKSEFNLALEALLSSPSGARTNPRIRAQFDSLVERISAYEITALAQGDGFAEKTYEPASIDELLAITTFDQPVVTAQTEKTVADDLQSTMHDIEIPLNGRVLSFVELFTGRLKGYLEDGLSRGARFLPMIQEVFRSEGLPLDLAYVPLVESAFKPNALSKASAKGIWQFMQGTGLENGLKRDWYIDERADPEKATRAAAKYLKTLYNMFDDWHLALASYNGGPGRVQKAMKRSGDDSFWDLSATTKFLPRETRDYVPLILAAVIVARNPVQYGLDIEPFQRPTFERVRLPHPMDLRRVAEWAGTPVQTIQDLNPELRRWTTPVRATDYELKVPTGTADLVRARLADASPDDYAPLNRHTVRKGETIRSIARKLKVSRTDLAEANYLSTKARLRTGQQLIIPRPPTLLLATRTESGDRAVESRRVDAVAATGTPKPKAERLTTARRTTETRIVHRVKRGETLYSIARLYSTTVGSVKQWNRLHTNTIKAGQRLTIVATRERTVATN